MEGASNIVDAVEAIMWTSTLELDLAHVIPTKLLGRIWHGVYFSSIAPFQVQNLPRQPLPAGSWVRVRNILAGICGSDLHLIFVDGDLRIAPAAIPSHGLSYPGHEVVGEVIEVGDEVSSLHVGDRVVLKNGPNCITAGLSPLCRSCTEGNYNLCERGNLPGPQPFGGGWSEEMLLHEQQLFRVPSALTDMQAVLLEPSAVAVHAVLRHIPRSNSRVLIIGAGTIGLLVLQVLRTLAPDVEISVMARHAFQVEQAARLGAQIIYPQDSYKEVQRITGAQSYRGPFGNQMLLGGYDAIYDTVGSNRTTHDALRWTRAGGSIVMVGLSLHRMHIDLTPIWYQEINLIGSTGQGRETWPPNTNGQATTFEIVTELIQQKRIQPEKLITHSFALNDYRNALLTATHKAENRAIKVVFDYAKQPPSVVPNVRAAARQRRRTITPVQVEYIDPRPSQPLLPGSEPLIPAAQPVPQAPLPPQQPAPPPTPFPVAHIPYNTDNVGEQQQNWQNTPVAEPDEMTVIVSRPRFPRYQSNAPASEPTQIVANQPGNQEEILDDADDDMLIAETEKFPRIDIESPPKPAPFIEEEAETFPMPDDGAEIDDELPLDADAFSTDIPTPTDSAEADVEAEVEVPPWLAALDNKPAFLPLAAEEEEGTSEMPDTATPIESEAASQTVIVSSPKRPRSRRKAAGTWQTKSPQGSRSAGFPSSPIEGPEGE